MAIDLSLERLATDLSLERYEMVAAGHNQPMSEKVKQLAWLPVLHAPPLPCSLPFALPVPPPHYTMDLSVTQYLA